MHPEPWRAGRLLWPALLLSALALVRWAPVTQAQSPDFGAEIFALTNSMRAEHGLPAYLWDERLAAAARRHANDMANTGWISHTGSDGTRVRDRAREAGYPGFSWGLVVGENIYGGYTHNRPSDAMAWWMNSPPHRGQILSTRFREMGAASASRDGTTYYVAVFGDRPDVPAESPPPVPPPPSAPAPAESAPVASGPPTTLPDGSIVYTIQPGDTLYAIWRRFGVSVKELMALNHLSEDSILYPGQQIVVRLGQAGAASESLPAPLDRPVARPVDLNNLPPGAVIYTVQAGDTLLAIALRYGVNPDDITALNALPDVNVLAIGQKLVISLTPLEAPAPAAPPPTRPAQASPGLARSGATAPAGWPVHIVREGDTLSAIAWQYGVSVAELVKLNRLSDPDALAIGQVLVLSAMPEWVYNTANTDRPPHPRFPIRYSTDYLQESRKLWLIAAPQGDDFASPHHIPQGS